MGSVCVCVSVREIYPNSFQIPITQKPRTAGGGFNVCVQYVELCVLPVYVVGCDEPVRFIGGRPVDLQDPGSCCFYSGW